MAPKVRPKGHAKAKAKGKAKAKAKARPRVMAVVRLRRPGMRRPASRVADGTEQSSLAKWKAGEVVQATEVNLDEFMEAGRLVGEKALYYQVECKVAGVVQGVTRSGNMTMLRMSLEGTTSEAVLKAHSSNPTKEFRLHLCPDGCNSEVVADDILHLQAVRQRAELQDEEGWVTNLLGGNGRDALDENENLRRRSLALGLEGTGGADPGEKDGKEEKKDKDKKEKKDKDKKEKKAKKKKKKTEKKSKGSDSSSEEVPVDGTRSKLASLKKPRQLFAGTGLDPKEKVRLKVAKRAKAYLKKSKDKSGSSSGEDETGSSDSHKEDLDESLFSQATKVRKVAEGFPGTLACQALTKMRGQLLSSIGEEDKKGALAPCCLQYYRQCLQRRASAPVQRELLTLTTMLDLVLRGRCAQALDIGVQRLKSQELVLTGVHWNVAQRLEVLEQETQALADMREVQDAQREVAADSKVKLWASQPEGRVPRGGKGNGKQTDQKGDYKGDKRKGGKGQGPKGDPGKRKDENAARS